MSTLKDRMGDKVHHRNISTTTHSCENGDIIVEGELIDNRLVDTFDYQGEKTPPRMIHHLIVRLLINGQTFTIDDVEVDMPGIPREQCIETADSLDRIKGIRIVQGFTLKIKEMYLNGQGCAHLVELLLAMAPAAVQGFWTALSQKPIPKDLSSMAVSFLTDTCWVWRKEGPAICQLIEEIDKKD